MDPHHHHDGEIAAALEGDDALPFHCGAIDDDVMPSDAECVWAEEEVKGEILVQSKRGVGFEQQQQPKRNGEGGVDGQEKAFSWRAEKRIPRVGKKELCTGKGTMERRREAKRGIDGKHKEGTNNRTARFSTGR